MIMNNQQHLFIKESLVEAFNYFDSDKTGYLEARELRAMLKDSPNQEIEDIIKALDTDKDQRISQH